MKQFLINRITDLAGGVLVALPFAMLFYVGVMQ